MSCNGCTGKCCTRFTFSVNKDQLARMIIAEKSGERYWVDKVTNTTRTIVSDSRQSLEFLQDMLINERVSETGNTVYDCKHYDKETTLCRVYSIRPGLCHEFGTSEGDSCKHEGCSFKG